MTQFDIDFSQLFQETNIFVTPNRRLSAQLHLQYQAHQIQNELRAWTTPQIMPLSAYIEKIWFELSFLSQQPLPLLLNEFQENYLWETILIQWSKTNTLLQVHETAAAAKSAWRLLKQWNIGLTHPMLHETEDSQFLMEWLSQFETRCRRENWTDSASLIDELLLYEKEMVLSENEKIVFIGFNEFTPQLLKFREWLKNYLSLQNIEQAFAVKSPKNNTNIVCRVEFHEYEEELFSAARWAYQQFSEGKNKVGIVLQNLENQHSRIYQIFNEVFADKSNLFNISAGQYLAQYPLIFTAIQLLHLSHTSITAENLQYLLSSPFLGEAEEEAFSRAKFDCYLRTTNLHKINLEHLLDGNNQHAKEFAKQCPKLLNRLSNFIQFAKINFHHEATRKDWVQLFTEALRLLGWPGQRSLNSEEYQTVEQWRSLLIEFQTLDYVASPCKFNHALQSLSRAVSKKLFQPMSPDAPIQILGQLEASGIIFDAIWITGVDDASWPPQPSPHPLLPKKMQRHLNMPHASAERELAYCLHLLKQFEFNTKTLICSYTLFKDELTLQASPLIQTFSCLNLNELALTTFQHAWEKIFESRLIETIIDDTAPPLKENEKVYGGSSIIKYQSACPFRAFAECRLHAKDLEKTTPGFNTKQRGILLHKTLELIWSELKNQQTLLNIADSALDKLIDHSVDQAIQSILSHYSERPQFIILEKLRLKEITRNWLEIEKQRDPFIVELSEKSIDITLDHLKLSLRIDRVDQLPDGKKIIIDYKTNKNTNIGTFFGERLEEPQLPLYALFDAQTIGISYAQIAKGGYLFNGVSQTTLNITGIKPLAELKQADSTNWEEQITRWQQTFNSLSQNFINGIAHVDPKDKQSTCQFCKLQAFCRINET